MNSRHHVAVQMEEEQQWQKDNGPIVKTADQLWKYSGETEESSEALLDKKLIEKESILLLDKGKYTIRTDKRSKILEYWLDNMDIPMKVIAVDLDCHYATVSKTIRNYLKEIKKLKLKTECKMKK
tara:strand:+ start:95743 stop:96117 length:375 start_codon:yes stop_codon:yes gene_type:complete